VAALSRDLNAMLFAVGRGGPRGEPVGVSEESLGRMAMTMLEEW